MHGLSSTVGPTMRTFLVAASLALWCALALPAAARVALTASTAVSDTECVCASDDPRKPQQLIRGKDQVAQCDRGDYCDCQTKTVQHCEPLPIFNEKTYFSEKEQMCDIDVNCVEYFAKTTAAPNQPSTPTPRPESCTCKDNKLPLQLIRGKDQVAQCEAGKYCDCKAKSAKKCEDGIFPMIFNEDKQSCDYSFDVDCEEYLDGPTPGPSTASPRTPQPTAQPTRAPAGSSTAAPTPAPQPCACQDDKLPKQLIRGKDQVAQCDRGDYCDCQTKTVQHCEPLPIFNEKTYFSEKEQMCDIDVNCVEYFAKTTAAPNQPSTPTPRPESCTCKDNKLPLQLIRGKDQVAQCEAGKYCDCKAKSVKKCEDGIFPMIFNEDKQSCDYSFDVNCEESLEGPSPAPSTATSRTPRASSPGPRTPGASSPSPRTPSWHPLPSSGGTQRTLSGLLYSLTALLVVVNLVIVSRRCCVGDLRVRGVVRAADAVPTVYSTDLDVGRKVALESTA